MLAEHWNLKTQKETAEAREKHQAQQLKQSKLAPKPTTREMVYANPASPAAPKAKHELATQLLQAMAAAACVAPGDVLKKNRYVGLVDPECADQ